MFGTAGSPYLLIQAINILFNSHSAQCGCLLSACKITTFCRNYQILSRKYSERQVIHAYLPDDTTFGFFSSIRS